MDATNTATRAASPPRVFAQYETFKAGNKRILEYNIHYGSVRIKSTPRAMVGKEVVYTSTGPKLVEAKGQGAVAVKGVGRGRGRRKAKEVVQVVDSEESELSEVDEDALTMG